METMKKIHLDELPERCRREVHRFFRYPADDHPEDGRPERKAGFCRNLTDYIILASKQKNGTNYSKWQTSFLPKTDFQNFKKHDPHYQRKYYLVWKEPAAAPVS